MRSKIILALETAGQDRGFLRGFTHQVTCAWEKRGILPVPSGEKIPEQGGKMLSQIFSFILTLNVLSLLS